MEQNTQADFFLPPDLVARALASLAERCEAQADGLDAQPRWQLTRGERAMIAQLNREAACFRAALDYWQAGYRPILLADGSYLVPSRTSDALFHLVIKIGGRWVCGHTCPQHGKAAHIHQALMLALEHAIEMASDEDDGDEPSPPPPEALGRRLALARAAAMDFNRDVFGVSA